MRAMDRRGFAPLIVIGIVAALAIIGATGYFAWKKITQCNDCNPWIAPTASSTQSIPQSSSKAIQPIATTTPAPQNNAGWKTYSNSQYSFSFQYPAAWGNPIVGSGTISFASPNPNADIPEDLLSFYITAKNGKTLDQIIAADSSQFGISYTPTTTIMVVGQPAKTFLVHREGGFANYVAYTTNGNYVYEISYGNWFWGDPAPADVAQSEQAIATLRFTQANSVPL